MLRVPAKTPAEGHCRNSRHRRHRRRQGNYRAINPAGASALPVRCSAYHRRPRAARHSAAQHGTARCSPAQPSPARSDGRAESSTAGTAPATRVRAAPRCTPSEPGPAQGPSGWSSSESNHRAPRQPGDAHYQLFTSPTRLWTVDTGACSKVRSTLSPTPNAASAM